MDDLNKITEVFPHAKDNDFIVSLVEALKEAKQMRIMATSEAGIKLSRELWAKCLDLILQIRAGYIKVPEFELRALCAALDTQMGLYEELTTSGMIQDIAQKELDEAVKGLQEVE